MEAFTISSFKFGLDSRRSLLTSIPGTLQTLQNAHINPGGEIEKRMAFVLFANLAILDSGAVPANALLDENSVPILDENGNYIILD